MSSKPDISLSFLKWLVTVLSAVMILGFLYLIIILGLKITNFNTTKQTKDRPFNQSILIPDGKIESIEVGNNLLIVIVKVREGHLEFSVVDKKAGILLNQYSIKQNKSTPSN